MEDHVNEDPELSPSGYALIAMIENGVTTGYAIKQELERFASFFWSASYGQIYPQLRRLEAAGMIAGRDTVSAGRLRREYAVTATGKDELRRYLTDPSEPTVWVQNEGILRLMLIDWSDRELVQEHLLKLRRVTARRRSEIGALSPPRERGRRIQALGMRILQETLNWCDETEAALLEPEEPS